MIGAGVCVCELNIMMVQTRHLLDWTRAGGLPPTTQALVVAPVVGIARHRPTLAVVDFHLGVKLACECVDLHTRMSVKQCAGARTQRPG